MSARHSPPREWQFLLAAAKLRPTPQDRTHIENELVRSDINWERVVQYAYQNDVGPLVYRSIRDATSSGSLPARLSGLKAAYAGNALRNTLLFSELQGVLGNLLERSKPVIVLKGAALADTVYGDRALRPMSDVDLLVRRSDIPAVEEILLNLGFKLDLKQREKHWYFHHYHHLVFRKTVSPKIGVCFEVHWQLERPGRPFAIDTEGIWERADQAPIAGVLAKVLSPEDLLLFLCLHTCKHRLAGGFRSFCDIAEVVRHFGTKINWGQLRVRCAEWRMDTFAVVPLQLAAQLLGAPVPKWVLDSLTPADFDDRLLNAARHRVFEERSESALFSGFYRVRTAKSPRAIALLFRRLFSSRAIAMRYGVSPVSRRILLYYPRRLMDLSMDYGLEFWRFVKLGNAVDEKAENRARLSAWLAPFGKDAFEIDF